MLGGGGFIPDYAVAKSFRDLEFGGGGLIRAALLTVIRCSAVGKIQGQTGGSRAPLTRLGGASHSIVDHRLASSARNRRTATPSVVAAPTPYPPQGTDGGLDPHVT